MQDIITIGSSLIDIFIKSPHFQIEHAESGTKLCQLYGEKLEVDSFEVKTGGGASNTAVGFARAGYTVACVTETGKDTFSGVLLDEFHNEFVSTRHVVQEKKEQTGGSVILVGTDGGRTVMVHRGASSLLDPHDIPTAALQRAKWVHLSSIAGRKATLETIGAAMQESQGYLSWNPGRAELELLKSGEVAVAQLQCKILFMNETEWQSVAALHTELRSQVGEIVVTNGGEAGKILIGTDDADTLTFTPQASAAVDETGAGDGFAVGYVCGRLDGHEPEEALQWGLRNAGSVIKYYGAKQGLLTQAQLAG